MPHENHPEADVKRLVNGKPHDFLLEASSFEIRQTGNLLQIRTDEGWKSASVVKVGEQVLVSYRGRQYLVAPMPKDRKILQSEGPIELMAPLPGIIVALRAKVGDRVEPETVVVLLEAMKTQIPVRAARGGVIEKLLVTVGQPVKANELLAVLES